jgi:aminoglycoside phosphotransferase (APT) family kinase protein
VSLAGIRPSGRRSPEQVCAALQQWFDEHQPAGERVILLRAEAPAAGASSETFALSAAVGAGSHRREVRWILRIEPAGERIYPDASVERQFRTQVALARHTRVPVPRSLWLETDAAVLGAPFFLMERVDGQLPSDRHHSAGLFAEATPEQREAMWLAAIEAMAEIHKADPADFRFLDRPELGATGLAQEIAAWDAYRLWSGAPCGPAQDRARQWLEDNRPAHETTGLAWGDARPGNMIFADGRCRAVIDWETASLGGAETDLGWWLFYDWLMAEGSGVPRLQGIGDGQALVSAWEGFAGRRAEAMLWHEVFAAWRFGLIRDRALKRAGLTPGQALGTGTRDPLAERLEMLTGR